MKETNEALGNEEPQSDMQQKRRDLPSFSQRAANNVDKTKSSIRLSPIEMTIEDISFRPPSTYSRK